MAVLSLTWEPQYLGKTVFLLRRGPGALLRQDINNRGIKYAV